MKVATTVRAYGARPVSLVVNAQKRRHDWPRSGFDAIGLDGNRVIGLDKENQTS